MKKILIFAIFCIFSYANICDEIKKNPNEFFLDSSNKDLFLKDENCFYMAKSLEPLREVSAKIRGLDIDCDGSEAINFWQNFQFVIYKALFAPEIYKTTLKDANSSDLEVNKNREYFQIWALQSFDNYEKFNLFNSLYQVAVPMLVDYYKDDLGYDEGSAIFYASRVANEYLKAAVGSVKNYQIDMLNKSLLNTKFDINLLINHLYTYKPTEIELTNALKTSILLNKDKEFIQTLINWGANLNFGHENTLFYALKNYDILKFLLKNGAMINYKNSFGKTPIFYACELNDERLVAFLIQNGADVNAKIISNYEKIALSSSGSLPFKLCALNHTSKNLLMHAAKYSNLNIIKLLIQNGANINEVDDMGYNAADFALQNNNLEVLRYLESLGLKRHNFLGEYYE